MLTSQRQITQKNSFNKIMPELDVTRRVSVSRHVSRHVFECLGLAMPMSRSRTLKISENGHVSIETCLDMRHEMIFDISHRYETSRHVSIET